MSTSQECLNELNAELDDLKAAIQDAQGAKLAPNTVNNVVELTLLRSFSVLEHFVERIFYLCMLNDPSVSGSGSLVPIVNASQADLLLMSAGDRTLPFLSWLPAARFLEAADKYLAQGHPFGRVRYRRTEIDALSEMVIVRNAVAHADSPAMTKFQELARSKRYAIKRPAEYLLSTRSGQLEVLLLMTRVELIARALVAPSDAAADKILEPESPFLAPQRAPVGAYRCKRCDFQVENLHPGQLGACPNCEVMTACVSCGRTPTPSSLWQRDVT